MNLLFGANLPPTGTNAGDVTLLSASSSGFVALSTNGMPPLVPGARYYLGVQNVGTVSVTAAVQVNFDVTPLANGVQVQATQPGNPLPRYFSYNVSSNGTAVSFQLLNLSGNLDLVTGYASSLPTLASFDYGSFNPGTNDEDILVFPDSSPVPLAPGRWYLGVFNAGSASAAYTILVTEYTNALPTIITLTSGVPYPNNNPGTGDPNDYYHYVVTTNALRAQFEIDSPTAPWRWLHGKAYPCRP